VNDHAFIIEWSFAMTGTQYGTPRQLGFSDAVQSRTLQPKSTSAWATDAKLATAAKQTENEKCRINWTIQPMSGWNSTSF
jgi:hypothetical protein